MVMHPGGSYGSLTPAQFIYTWTSTPNERVGARMPAGDRTFFYAKMVATTAAGLICSPDYSDAGPMLLADGSLVAMTAAAGAAQQSVVAPGASVEKLAGGFIFTEGPAADAEGNVCFTDIPNNRILRWSLDGELSTFREDSGGANGLFFDKQGNLVVRKGDVYPQGSFHSGARLTTVFKKVY